MENNITQLIITINKESLSTFHLLGRISWSRELNRAFTLKVSGFKPEMEYCASAASMLAEEIWQIAEGFAEVPVNLLVQLIKCGKNISND